LGDSSARCRRGKSGSVIGTQALKARSRAAQGVRSERSEDLEPWVKVAVYESPEGVKQPRPYSIKPT